MIHFSTSLVATNSYFHSGPLVVFWKTLLVRRHVKQKGLQLFCGYFKPHLGSRSNSFLSGRTILKKNQNTHENVRNVYKQHWVNLQCMPLKGFGWLSSAVCVTICTIYLSLCIHTADPNTPNPFRGIHCISFICM